MIVSIYLARNTVTGRCYIGQTKLGVSARWKKHCSGVGDRRRGNHPLYNALRKYGKEAFAVSLLAASSAISRANELEQRYIAERNTVTPNGYNIALGGQYGPLSVEHRKRISLGLKGKPLSEAHRQALRDGAKGRHYKPGCVSPLKGRTRPDAIKRKISATLTGFKRPPRSAAYQLAASVAQRGKRMPEATRTALAASIRERWRKYREARDGSHCGTEPAVEGAVKK